VTVHTTSSPVDVIDYQTDVAVVDQNAITGKPRLEPTVCTWVETRSWFAQTVGDG